jgi:hypothetical protein
MNVAAYLAKQYPNPPCWALVSDVYATELGQDVTEYRTINNTLRAIASAFRIAMHKGQHGLEQLDAPADYAIVLLGRSRSLGLHHCGIVYEGKVLHALADGNLYQDMASLGDTYPVMQFWGRA